MRGWLTGPQLCALQCKLCARMHLVHPWSGPNGRKNAQAAWWGAHVTSFF